MNTAPQIREVYIDSDEPSKEKVEAQAILRSALGTLAIGEVETPAEADAMIVIGGDGSFLHAIRRHHFPDVPVAGINTGTLGFYMNTPPTEEGIEALAQDLAAGEYTQKSLPLLEVPVPHEESVHYAINEVVVERKSSQAFKASLQLGEGQFEHFVGDGFIFSTPQGSTSYSLSAGGPILHEDVDAYVVAPSNPHKSGHYYSLRAPAIVPADVEAVVEAKEVEKRPFLVSVDGNTIEEWPDENSKIPVRVASDKRLQIVRFHGHDYFAYVSSAFGGTIS